MQGEVKERMSLANNYSDALVDFIAHTPFDEIPDHVVEHSKLVLLDSLICGIAASRMERSRMLSSIYEAMGGVGEATMLGSPLKVPAAHAVAANAEMMNLLDADDTFFTSSHFAAFTAAACLAEAERSTCSGRDLIRAMAIGYDINARIFLSQISIVKGEDGRFEYSPVQGMGFAAFGTAVSAAAIRKMNRASLRRMLGVVGWLAPTPTCDPQADKVEHNSFKYANYGSTALAGMMAIHYTEVGYRGQDDILDSGAFMRGQGCLDTDLSLLTEELGKKWWIEDSSIKLYPACRYTSAPIDMLLSLMSEQHLAPDDIESLEIEMSPVAYAMKMFNDPAREIAPDHRAPLNGAFNIPYVMALAALGYKPGPHWYSEACLTNREVWEFAGKVTTTENRSAHADIERALSESRIRRFRKNPSAITVRARGREYELRADYAHGDPWQADTMPSWETLYNKFENFCDGILRGKQIETITETIRDLENCERVSLPGFSG